MTALDVIQRTVRVLGVTDVPTTIVGNDDPQVVNLIELLNDVGQEIAQRHDWNMLRDTFFWTSVGSDPQLQDIPSNWARSFPIASVWRSGSVLTPLSGPVPPDIWHRLLVMPGVRFPGYWRMFQTGIQTIGVPASETIQFEYVTNTWVLDQDGSTAKNVVSKDGDTFKLDERLLRLGLIYQWRSFKGLSYAEEMTRFEAALELQIAADRSAREISTARPYIPDARGLAWPGMVINPS